MITYKFISVLGKDAGPQAIAGLRKIYPDGRDNPRIYSVKVAEADPRGQQLLDYLASRGFTVWDTRQTRRADEFALYFERAYDQADFEAARLMEVSPEPYVDDAERTPEGLLRLSVAEMPPEGVDFALVQAPCIVVSSRIRKLMEREAMAHLVFRPTEIAGTDEERKRHAGGYWELTSDLLLPPMMPPCTLVDAVDFSVVGPDHEWPYLMREGEHVPEVLFTPAEAHYSAAAIERLGPFDLALTLENFGDEYSRWIMASPRFYRFCVAQRLEAKWTPARIDAP